MAEEKKKRERKKSGFLGKFVAAFLGFLLGAVAGVGGIAGAGYYIVSQVPIKDGIDSVGDATGSNINYQDFVTEEFASNTILSAFGEVGKLMEEVSAGTASLSSLERFSPLVRNKIAEIIPALAKIGINVDLETLMTTPFTELATYAMEIIDKTEIGKIAASYSGSLGDGILKLLSYGEENFEYVMEDLDGDGHADVSMLGNNKPTVVGDLTSGNLFSGPLANVSVAQLAENASGFADDIIFRTVLYGEEGVDYIMVGDTMQMLPRVYAFAEETFKDMESGRLYTKNGSNWLNANGYVISANTENDGFAYVVKDKNGEVVEKLKPTATPNVYETYRISSQGTQVKQLRRGLTVGDLFGGNLNTTDILNKIAIGDLLKLHAGSESILLTIAYGQEGIDYQIVNGEIVPITEPTKVGDLFDSDTLMEKLMGFYLADVMDVSPLNPSDADAMLIQLAYGEEDVHYTLVDTNNDGTADKIEWLINPQTGTPYGKRTFGDLFSEDNNIFDNLSVASILNVKATEESALLLNLAYGSSTRWEIVGDKIVMKPIVFYMVDGKAYDDVGFPYDGQDGNGTVTPMSNGVYKLSSWKGTFYVSDKDNDGVFHAYATQADAAAGLESTRLHYQRQMLSSLRGGESNLFLNDIELGSALNIKPTDGGTNKLMVALAYGYEGTHFEINGGKVTWKTNPSTGLPYRPRTLKDLGELQTIIQTIKIGDFLDEGATQDNPLLATFVSKGWTIGDLSSANINELKLGEILNVSPSDKLLYALRESTIGGLETAIKGLTITDLLDGDISGHMFLKHLTNVPISEIPTAMNELTIVQVFANDVYKPGTTEFKGAWKYMLKDKDGLIAPEAYTLKDFNELIENMSTAMGTATLQQLSDDGVLTFGNLSLTQTKIMGISISTLANDPSKITLGDLSLSDLLTIIVEYQEFPVS